MGYPDQLSKYTFAVETPVVTANAVVWEKPPEIPTAELRPDGYLRVIRPDALGHLPWPWPGASRTDEVVLETKMPGDHSDAVQLERALLRRQARQVQRASEAGPANVLELNDSALWFLAPNLPKWVERKRNLVKMGAGCYSVEPTPFPFLWVAANELPLHDALVSFLVARSGRPLVEFIRWVAQRRPLPWLTDVVSYLSMTDQEREQLRREWLKPDPAVEENFIAFLRSILPAYPTVTGEIEREGAKEGAAAVVGHLIERRLRRPMAASERAVLRKHLDLRGAEYVGDLVLDLPADKLAEWLASSADH